MGRGRERLDRFAEDIGQPVELLTHVGDASEHAEVIACVKATVDRFGWLGNVVADAGFAVPGNLATGQLAASIVWALDQPGGVDVNTVTMRPIG